MNLDPKQKQVLGLKRDTAVIAGAGAGKTTTLVSAVINDLIDTEKEPAELKCLPEEIAVITFTRAAAANLVQKLSERLDELIGGGEEIIDRLQISTIDSLYYKLLKKSYIRPEYIDYYSDSEQPMIVELASGIKTKQLGIQALEETIQSVEDIEFIESFPGDILKIFENIYSKEIEKTTEQIVGSSDLKSIPEAFQMKFKFLSSIEEPLTGPLEKDVSNRIEIDLTAEQHLLRLAERELEIKSDKLDAGVLDDIANKILSLLKDDLSETNWKNYNKKLIYPLHKNILPITHITSAGLDNRLLIGAYNKYLTAFYIDEFTQRFYKKYLEWKERYTALLSSEKLAGYSEITKRAAEASLLIENDLFQKIYLDEAQDTSPIQFEILKRLVRKDGLILIGDPNQSIYAFRGADVDNYNRFTQNVDNLVLNDNYRSRKEILEIVHQLFQDNTFSPAGIEAFPKMISHQSDPGRIDVQGVFYSGNASRTTAEAEMAAIKIKELDYDYKDIAILVRNNTDVTVYERVLIEHDIPVIAYSDKHLLRQEESKDIIAYLTFILDPNNQKSLARILSSPFANLSIDQVSRLIDVLNESEEADIIKRLKDIGDDERLEDLDLEKFISVIEESIRQLENLSVKELLTQAMIHHGYIDNISVLNSSENYLNRISKVINYMQTLEDSIGRNRYQLLKMLDYDLLDSPEDTVPEDLDAVKIMTVHNSKGDEFPVVILGDILKSNNRPDTVSIEEDYLIIATSLNGWDLNKFLFPTIIKIEEQNKRAGEEEKHRLLYVAMTRAEEELVISHSILASFDESAPTEVSSYIKEPLFEVLFQDVELDNGNETKKTLVTDDQEIEVGFKYFDSNRLQNYLASNKQDKEVDLDSASAVDTFELIVSKRVLTNSNLNYSQLYAWKQCSLRKFLEYDLNLTEHQSFGESNKSEVSGARRFGENFHNRLKSFSDLAAVSDKSIYEIMSETKEEPAQEYIKQMLDDPELSKILKEKQAVAEEKIIYKIGDCPVTSILDYVVSGDNIMIIDWKTGNWESVEELPDSKKEEHAYQRKLYSYGYLLGQPEKTKVAARTYYVSGTEISYIEDVFVKDKSFLALEEELTDFIETILESETKDPYLKEEAFYCAGCPGLTRVCSLSKK